MQPCGCLTLSDPPFKIVGGCARRTTLRSYKRKTVFSKSRDHYPTCGPLVRFSHIGSIEDAARDGPCAHGNVISARQIGARTLIAR